MGDLLTWQKYARVGRQSADLFTANPWNGGDKNSNTSNDRWCNTVLSIDGLKGRGTQRKVLVPTEHRYRGGLVFARGPRNAEPGSLLFPLFPESAKLMLDFMLALDSDGRLEPYTIEQWYASTMSGSGTGRQLVGCIGQSFTISIDRKGGAGSPFVLSAPFFLNQDIELTSAVPSFTVPPLDPYNSLHTLLDLVQIGGAFAGDHADIMSVEITVNQGTSISNFRGHPSTESLNGTWRHWKNKAPEVSIKVTLKVTNSQYLNYKRSGTDTDWKMRVAAWHPNSNFSANSTSTLTIGGTPGSTQNITVASSTGAAAGDIIIAQNDLGTIFNVFAIQATGFNSTTIPVLNEQILQAQGAGTYRLRNAALFWNFPKLELDDVGDPYDVDGDQCVDLNFMGRVDITDTVPYSYLGINDDNT